MQNAVYQHLCAQHGKRSVQYEREFVDLRLELHGSVTLLRAENRAHGEEVPARGDRPIIGIQQLPNESARIETGVHWRRSTR